MQFEYCTLKLNADMLSYIIKYDSKDHIDRL